MRKYDMIALSERGIAYYNLGKVELAEKDFKKALKNEPDNQVFQELLAYIQ